MYRKFLFYRQNVSSRIGNYLTNIYLVQRVLKIILEKKLRSMGYFGVDCVCVLLVIITANVAWWLTVCQARWELWGSARMLHLCGLGSPPASCFRGRDTEAWDLKSVVVDLNLLSFIYRIILESELWFSKHDWMWAPKWKKSAGLSRSPGQLPRRQHLFHGTKGSEVCVSVLPTDDTPLPNHPIQSCGWGFFFCVARQLLQLSS